MRTPSTLAVADFVLLSAASMRRAFLTAVTVLVVIGPRAAAQVSDSAGRHPADSVAAALAGAHAGEAAGHMASVSGARWGSAAATFFLMPFVGGVGVLVASSSLPRAIPQTIPAPVAPIAPSAAYELAYRDAFRAAYLPRRRHAMRTAMLITTVVFVAGVASGCC